MHFKHAASLGLVLLLFAGAAGGARACQCVGGSLEEYVGWTDQVFVGRVDSIVVPSPPPGGVTYTTLGQDRSVAFTAERWWKGTRSQALTVWTGSGGGDCGAGFTVGQRYLVFAKEMEDGVLQTDICLGTQNVPDAVQLSALGPGLASLPDVDPAPWEEPAPSTASAVEAPPDRRSNSLVWVVPALLLSLGLGVALGRYTRRAA